MDLTDILAIYTSLKIEGIKDTKRVNGISQHVHILNNDIPMNRFMMIMKNVVFSAMHSYTCLFQLEYQYQLMISPDTMTIPIVIYWKDI